MQEAGKSTEIMGYVETSKASEVEAATNTRELHVFECENVALEKRCAPFAKFQHRSIARFVSYRST